MRFPLGTPKSRSPPDRDALEDACHQLALMTFVILLVPLLVATVTAELHPDTGPPGRHPALRRLETNTEASHRSSGTRCQDWDESWSEVVRVLEGEAAWVRCPLSGHPARDNSSRDLTWYRRLRGQHLERPITHNGRLSKERDRLCFQPAAADDSGCYACLPRERSAGTETWVRVTVVRRPQVAPGDSKCERPLAVAPDQVVVALQSDQMLECPDRREAADMADAPPAVTWYHACSRSDHWTSEREQVGAHLQIHNMVDHYQGLYTCQVHYRRGGRALHFTRGLNVTAVSPPFLPKEPSVLQPTSEHVFRVKRGSSVRLVCRGRFPYLDRDSDRAIWWSVDGNAVHGQPADPRFSASNKLVSSKYGDRVEESVLLIRDFGSEDLGKTYNCSVRNRRGFQTRRAQLREEAWVPWLQVGCGLALILALSLAVSALCGVFRLELLLLYRSRFGADERHTDDKEFDVYISYARNSDEEKFVLRTLRTVLENHLGYTLCIFDRDSLPGGTITDETLRFVARSRRLLVVLGPGYARQGSQALLELKAGMDGLAGGHLRLILLQYKRVRRREWVRELRRARVALAVVRWQGERSREMTSRFWKKLRLELPVRRTHAGHGESGAEAGLVSPPAGRRAPLDLEGS
ncbi:interleukin-1 receptor accessory protein-like [Hippocampus zosterae]|uniref:interleukin-1 receptor accessory protein-like n=1 Tax=Hippocampus zosterae TaxID=109293 RepID=UPI00223CB14E|nr:interleukin-1 receptor accessory protein-like [Hippocampus zosterae]